MAFTAGAVDYLESATITVLLIGYPTHRDGVAWLASALTASKLSLYFLALVLALGGSWLTRKRRRGIPRSIRPEVS